MKVVNPKTGEVYECSGISGDKRMKIYLIYPYAEPMIIDVARDEKDVRKKHPTKAIHEIKELKIEGYEIEVTNENMARTSRRIKV